MLKKVIIVIGCFFIFGCTSKSNYNGKKVTIRFSNAEVVVDQIKIMKEIVKAFEKENPDIKIKMEWGITPEKILTEVAAGAAPDVFMWWMGLDDLIRRDALYQMSDFVKKYNIDMNKYFSCIVDHYTYNGKLYAFPLQVKTMCLAYNKNFFNRNNIQYPNENWTWNDFLKVAQELTDEKIDNKKRKRFGTLLLYVDQWIGLNGGSIVDVNNKKCVIDSHEAKETLEFLIKLNKTACPTQTELSSFSGKGGVAPFLSGNIAMIPAPAWMLAPISNIRNFKWDIVPMPKPPRSKTKYTFDDAGLVLSKNSKHPEEAFRFISFYCGPKGMNIFAKGRNGIPAYKNSAYNVFMKPPPQGLKYYLDVAEKATIPINPRLLKFNEMKAIFIKNWNKVLFENRNLDDTLKNIKRDINVKFKELDKEKKHI